MSNSKPLSYPNLKAVLLYLEPNLRLTISLRLPSIRRTERLVPLRLGSFSISKYTLQIGDQIYDLGITRFDEEWNAVGDHKSTCDFDAYGFKIGELKPTQAEIDAYLAKNKSCVVHRKSGFWSTVPTFLHYQRLANQYALQANESSTPFKHLLHLTIRKEKECTHIFLEYTRSLSDAWKYLVTKILGGRTEPMIVKNLILPAGAIVDQRWRFAARNLIMRHTLETIRPNLATTPDTIQVTWLNERDYPMLRSARKIVVSSAQSIRRVTFQRVHFESLFLFPADDLMDEIENWRERIEAVGTYYSYDMESQRIPELVEAWRARDEVVVWEVEQVDAQDERRYRIPYIPPELIIPIYAAVEVSIRFVEHLSRPGYHRLDMRVQSTRVQRAAVAEVLVLKNVPLSDACRKVVISGMAPGFRVFLSRQNQSLALLEKSVPLKVEHLSMTASEVLINTTAYQFELKAYGRKGNHGRYKPMKMFPAAFNVDKYGLRVPSTFLPGDLNFGLREDLADLDEEYEKIKLEVRKRGTFDMREYLEMQKHHWKKEGKGPSFKHFLVLTVSEDGEPRHTEFIEYHQNHHTAMKYLLEKVLGGRPALHVKNLALEAENNLVRTPESLRMTVKNLSVQGNKNGLKLFQPMLENLGGLDLDSISTDQIAKEDQEILSKAKTVIMTKELEEHMTHPRVIFNYFNVHHMIRIINRWKIEAPKVGTHFSFACKLVRNLDKIEKLASERETEIGEVKETRLGPSNQCVIFPINKDLECTVHLLKQKHTQHLNPYDELDENLNRFEMIIQPMGTATRFQFDDSSTTTDDSSHWLGVSVLALIVLGSIFVRQ